MLETAAPRLELARDILGDERMSYVDTSGADGERAVRDATDDIGADVVIVACSSDIAQEQAMEMAAPRGRVLFFGGLPKGTTHMRFPSNILHYLEVQVHGSYASRHRDQVHALDMLANDVGGIRRVVVGRGRARRGPRGLRAHPRRRGAQGRRGAVSDPPPIAPPLDRRGPARTDRGRASWRPATACPASPSWRASLGVSRSSLRAGIALLEEDGLIRRLHGSGTYVTHRPLMRNDLSRNFAVSSMIAAMGLEPGTVDEQLRRRAGPPRRWPTALGVEPGAPVSTLRRVRTADGRRVVDAIDWCRTDLLAPTSMRDLEGGSIYAALAERGLRGAPRRGHDHARRGRATRSPGGWRCRAARCC